MIHLMTRGGLGNQMFQYALALRIQKVNNDKSICINGLIHPLSIDKRQQSLHHFQLKKGTKICSFVYASFQIGCFLARMLRVAGIKCIAELIKYRKLKNPELAHKLLHNGLYYTSNAYSMPQVCQYTGTKHIYAYSQTPDVLSGIEEDLKDAFVVKTPPSAENQALLDEIHACNAVCLHIRRGDYGLYPQYQVCDQTYYETAIKQACEVLENPVFYVFSNSNEDIQWIKENYHFDAELRYVELENPDYEELRLMSACQHFIISNSTFSWWAAVLGSNAAKKVWAPKIWFHGTDVSMTLDSWTLI